MLSPNLRVAMNDEEKSLAKVVLYRWISIQLRQKQFNVLSCSYPMLQHSDMEGEMAQVQYRLSFDWWKFGIVRIFDSVS